MNIIDHKKWIKETYDRASEGFATNGCSFFEYFGERLIELNKPKFGNHILDIGTGKGAALFPAAKVVGSQGRAVGIDLSSKMLEQASIRKSFPWVELYEMDAENLTFQSQSFDVIYCAFAIFFFTNISRALAECYRVLKLQGRMAISTFSKPAPLDFWISEKAKELGATSQLANTSLTRVPHLLTCLKEAGFSTIEMHEETKIFWHENSQAWWDSLWTHGTRSKLEQLSIQQLKKLKEEALIYAGTKKVKEERHVLYILVSKT